MMIPSTPSPFTYDGTESVYMFLHASVKLNAPTPDPPIPGPFEYSTPPQQVESNVAFTWIVGDFAYTEVRVPVIYGITYDV